MDLGSWSVVAAQLLADSAGEAHGRDPARLRHHNVAGLRSVALCQHLLQEELRDLGALPAARLTGHHHHRVAPQSLQDTAPVLEDWKLLSLGLKE